jgi:hypothetical protein
MARKRLAAGNDRLVFVGPIKRLVEPNTPEYRVQFRVGGKVLRQCKEFLGVVGSYRSRSTSSDIEESSL